MNDAEAGGQSRRLIKKQLYEWSPPVRPEWSDLFAGGDRARAWAAYWISGKIHDAFDLSMHRLLQWLPLDWTSDFGAALGWLVVSRFKKTTFENGRRNFRRFRPDWSERDIEGALQRLYRHLGRVMAEFSILPRAAAAGRLQIVNAEALQGALQQGPVVLVSLHLGNWEVTAAALDVLGIRWADIYTPPNREVQHRIANEVREGFGIELLPPGRAGVRPAIRVLQGGGMVSIFCDETHKGRTMGPFLGRPPHTEGNSAIAVRMARMTGARIVIGYTVRMDGFRFETRFEEPIEYAAGEASREQLMTDVIALNDRIEVLVKDHLDQWYYLDNDF